MKPSFSNRPRGVALLLALLIVLLLSVALTDFLFRSRVDLDAAGNFEKLQQAHYAALAGIEAAEMFISVPGIKPNEWADALLQFGVPNFAAGGWIDGADEFKKTQPQQELEGEFFNDDTPSLTGIDLAFEANYDLPRNDPYGFNNGYLYFIASQTGLNFFDTGGADDENELDAETDIYSNNIDVELKFIDESSRLNLNALYYCGANCGQQSNDFNRVLYFQIRQLFVNQLIREKERTESKFSKRESERKEEATDERSTQEGSRFEERHEPQDIDNIMCAILDWLDPDDLEGGYDSCREGAESDEYLRLESPYEPRNGPMESVGELRLVKGITAEIYREVAPFLTVYPQDPNGADCNHRLSTLRSNVPDGEKLVCFDDRVNLMAASDQVIRAWAIGGFDPANYTDPDLQSRDNIDFSDEVLTLLNCARLPKEEREKSGCPETPPGTNEPPECWQTSAQVKQALEVSGIYAIQEVGETKNVGTASKQGLNCSAGGGGGADPTRPENFGGGALNTGNTQQSFRRLVGDYITIEAIGVFDLLEDEGETSDQAEDESLDEEDAGTLPSRIEAHITATYHVDGSKTPPELKLLRWQEY